MKYQTSLRKGGKNYDQTRIHKKTIETAAVRIWQGKSMPSMQQQRKAGKTQEQQAEARKSEEKQESQNNNEKQKKQQEQEQAWEANHPVAVWRCSP